MHVISLQKRLNDKETLVALVVFSLVFFFNPLLGILTSTLFIFKHKGQSEYMQYGLYAFIAIYFGLINTTKVPESDLLVYKGYFDRASFLSLEEFMALFNQELIFYFSTYILNKIFFGNFALYLIFTTFISYFLVFISIHKFWKVENKSIILYSVFIFASYNSFFFGTGLIIRQILAESIFLYFFIERIVNNKNRWFLIPLAAFIHSSSLILFLICFIPKLKEKISLKTFMILLVTSVVLFVFGSSIIRILDSYTQGINWLNYPFRMYNSMGLMEDSWYDGKSVDSIRLSYLMFFIFPIVFAYSNKNKGSRIFSLFNFCIIYVGILELFVAANFTFMQLRLAFYLPMFIPFVWPVFFLNKRIFYTIEMRSIGMTVLLIYFIFNFLNSFSAKTMTFAAKEELLFNPVFSYFLN